MVKRTGRLRRTPMPAIDRGKKSHSLRGADDVNPTIMFTIEFSRNSHVGSAEIDLFEAIHKAGSLSQAARDLRVSYKHAWWNESSADWQQKVSKHYLRPQRTRIAARRSPGKPND